MHIQTDCVLLLQQQDRDSDTRNENDSIEYYTIDIGTRYYDILLLLLPQDQGQDHTKGRTISSMTEFGENSQCCRYRIWLGYQEISSDIPRSDFSNIISEYFDQRGWYHESTHAIQPLCILEYRQDQAAPAPSKYSDQTTY